MRFLGTNMPERGVFEVVEQHQADVVGISATMLFSVPRVRALVGELRARSGRPLAIVLGGAAFRAAPRLYEELGADGFAPDLGAAIALLRTFDPTAPRSAPPGES